MDVTYGLVTQVSPTVQVRFAGDTVDVTVGLKNDDVTLATNDKVCLMRVGTQWVVAFVIGAA